MNDTEDTEVKNTRRGVVLYDKNPFVLSMTTKTRRITNKRGDMMLVNKDTGEVQTNIAGFWEAEEVDSTKFVKLFINGVKALAELTNAGTRVFELLYIELQNHIGKDEVYLSYTAMEKTTSMSRTTFSRGVKELVEKKFIAPSVAPGKYYVNPDYLWNGDRLTFVKEYRKRTQIESKDNQTMDLELD